jgi:hypothetical protein
MKHDDAMAAQAMMIGLSDDPAQLRASQFEKLFAQARNAKYGDGDELNILETPF